MFKHLNYCAVYNGFLRLNGILKDRYHSSQYPSLPFMITIFYFRRQLRSYHSYRLTVQYYAVKRRWHNLFVCPRVNVSCSVKLVTATELCQSIFLSTCSSLCFLLLFFFFSTSVKHDVLSCSFCIACSMEAVKKRKHIYVAQFYYPFSLSLLYPLISSSKVSACVPGLRSYTYKYTLFFFSFLVTAKYCVGYENERKRKNKSARKWLCRS